MGDQIKIHNVNHNMDILFRWYLECYNPNLGFSTKPKTIQGKWFNQDMAWLKHTPNLSWKNV